MFDHAHAQKMLIPVRCGVCNKVLGNLEPEWLRRLAENKTLPQVLEERLGELDAQHRTLGAAVDRLRALGEQLAMPAYFMPQAKRARIAIEPQAAKMHVNLGQETAARLQQQACVEAQMQHVRRARESLLGVVPDAEAALRAAGLGELAPRLQECKSKRMVLDELALRPCCRVHMSTYVDVNQMLLDYQQADRLRAPDDLSDEVVRVTPREPWPRRLGHPPRILAR